MKNDIYILGSIIAVLCIWLAFEVSDNTRYKHELKGADNIIRMYDRLYQECNTKIKNDSTHKDCVYKTK